MTMPVGVVCISYRLLKPAATVDRTKSNIHDGNDSLDAFASARCDVSSGDDGESQQRIIQPEWFTRGTFHIVNYVQNPKSSNNLVNLASDLGTCN